jgi:hypothetical protein
MDIIKTLSKMYYIPTYYYWLDQDNLYDEVTEQIHSNYVNSQEIYHRNMKIYNKLIEKTNEYNEYKSNLIRLILFHYAHNNPNGSGKQLILNILNKWKDITSIKSKDVELIYNRSFNTILKHEKNVNNIEDIMMLINLKMLENYYE